MRVIWAEQAREEWAAQYRWYFARNPEAARRMRAAVMGGAGRLRTFPLSGKPGRVEGTRELVIPGTPFLIVYEANAVQVEILHLLHGRQNYPPEGE